MADLLDLDKVLNDFERSWRTRQLEAGKLIDVTARARKVMGVKCTVDISDNLFKKLFPYAEEANKEIHWEERLYDLLKEFKRNAMFDAAGKQLNFELKIETNVKKVHAYDKIETFKNSKKITEVIPIWASWSPNEHGRLGLIFGLRKE